MYIFAICRGLTEEEATVFILYWQARQLSLLRMNRGLPGRYYIETNNPGRWPCLAYDPQATHPPLPEAPPMPPPSYVFQGE